MHTFQKFFLSLFVFSFLSINLSAQYGPQFDNRGFEQWTNRVSEPTHWHSGGTATGTWSSMVPNSIEQSTHPRPGSSGSKSVRLYPESVWGVTANGNLTNGRMNAGSMSPSGSDNYNYTQRNESAFNTSINQLPDSLTVWVCFRCSSTSSRAQVKAVVHGDADYRLIANGTESPADKHVATAALSFNRTAPNGGSYNWRRLSIPFQNTGPCTDVRYILMTATTNETPGSGSTSDDLFVDDILLVYNPTLSMGQLASSSYAPGDAITIPFTLTGTMSPDNLNKAANQVIAQLSDSNGNFNNPTELGRVTTNTNGSITAQIPNVSGQYTIRVISTNYPLIGQNPQQVTIASPSYTISVSANPSNGGTVTGGGEYTSGQSCTVTATANTGFAFTNWTENGNVVSTNANYTFNVTGNRSLVANFTLNAYSITATADPSNGGSVTGAGEYNHGASCTLTASANQGYTFVNWTKNGSQVSTNASYTFTVTESAAYVAHFQLQSYTITASADPSDGGSVNGAGDYYYGASCTLTASANQGYTFVNWTKNGSQVSTNANYTFTVTEAGAYVAHFSLNNYEIITSASPASGGNVTGGGTFNYGQSCTVTATANTGYTFTNWTENGNVVSSNANYTFTVEGNRNLVANFTAITYTITVSANPSNSGTTSGGGTYTHGQSCTVIATSADGYTFMNWTENGSVVSTDANYSFIVTSNRSLVANFEEQQPDTYNINVSPNPNIGGTVTGGGNYDAGQQCTVTATANTGYTFVNWTENGEVVTTNASYTFIVTGNRTLVANFTLNSYSITVTADPTEGGMVTGAGNYNHGTSCTLTATANENYEFINWTKNGIEVSTDATYTFMVTASEEYVAHFYFDDLVGENASTCQIFPNPFTSSLSITAENAAQSVSVYDLNGRLLIKQNINELQFEIDLSQLTHGTYLLQIDYGNSRSVHRIMKAE